MDILFLEFNILIHVLFECIFPYTKQLSCSTKQVHFPLVLLDDKQSESVFVIFHTKEF